MLRLPPQNKAPCNIHAAITLRFCSITSSKPACIYAHGNTRWQQSCSHSNAICNQIQETHRTTHRNNHSLQNTEEEPIERPQTAPAAHTRYLSSPAEATLHGKTQGFVLRLPPQNKAHATFMQPLHCVSQHHVANRIASTHMATPLQGRNRWQQSCSHSNAICNHRFKKRIELRTQEQPLVAKHRGGTIERPQPHPPHTRGTFHRRLQPLYTEKHKVSCSGFLPKTKPMQHSCCMQHHSCTWQHSCSHAICNHSFKKRIELRTQEQPLVAEHRGGTIERPQPHPPHTRGTGWSHFTRKIQGFVLRLPPQNKAHATFMQPLPLRFVHPSLHALPHGNTQPMTTIMQPFQCDLQPQLQETHRTTHTGTTTRCRTQRRNRLNDPSRTRRTHEVPFIAGCSHFTRKNTRFRAPASPKQSPCNIQAITLRFTCQPAFMATPDVTTIMQPFQCDLQPQIQETHRTTHTGTTTRCRTQSCRTQRRNQTRNDPSRTRRTHEVPFIAGCSHFTQKNTRFRAPASSPKQSPMQHSCSHYNAICSTTASRNA